MDIREKCDIAIYSGDDSLLLPILSIGGVGVVSVLGNILPNKIKYMITHFKQSIFETQKEFYKLYPLIKMIFIETNPSPIKELMFHNEMINTIKLRAPMYRMEPHNRDELIKCYTTYIS